MTIDPSLANILLGLSSSAVLSLIGFVWKISHKVSAVEKEIQAMERRHSSELKTIHKDIEIIYSNVDKNREWTTNRMMSIAKDLKT